MKQSIFKLFFTLFLMSYLFNPTQAYATLTVWEVLRDHMQLDHAVNQPQVQSQIRWLINHPSYIQELGQSEPYIYHILTEIKKKHLPAELALIPMIESTFDPFAYSNRGAAGLWQIMPKTGSELGLKQDWWFDGRRSITPSTNAALHYLSYLNEQFDGNWLLAIAAYDAGEGTISKALKANGTHAQRASFWHLKVPTETRNYVPRLLALAEIIKYADHYHVTLPDIPHVPYFEEVNINGQINLNHAAKLAGMSYRDLLKLNPGYNHASASPKQPYKLLIPTEKVEDFYRNLALLPRKDQVSWLRHTVRGGETLKSLARNYFTSVQMIKELNQLRSDKLHSGQSLLIPSNKNAPFMAAKKPAFSFDQTRINQPSVYKVLHIVQPFESFQTIALKYHVTPDQIRQWNQLENNALLTKNQQLIIWKNNRQPTIYIVKKGDKLDKIARNFNMNLTILHQLNPGIDKHPLKPGQRLNIG